MQVNLPRDPPSEVIITLVLISVLCSQTLIAMDTAFWCELGHFGHLNRPGFSRFWAFSAEKPLENGCVDGWDHDFWNLWEALLQLKAQP